MLQITIKSPQKKFPIPKKLIRKAVLKTLKPSQLKKTGEINILITGNRLIKKINRRYFNDPRSTDVIAFDLSPRRFADSLFFDVVVSYDTAKENRRIYGTSFKFEMLLYIVHGLLHLNGYDDKTEKTREIMNKKAAAIVTGVYAAD